MNRPIPETTISNLANSHEDTLLLLDLMRHKRQQEGQKKRVRKDKVSGKISKLLITFSKLNQAHYTGGYDPRDGIAAEEEEGGGELGQLPPLVELQDCHLHNWGNLNFFTFTNILKYCMHRKHAGHIMVRLGQVIVRTYIYRLVKPRLCLTI